MSRTARALQVAIALLVVGVAGARIVATRVADLLASDSPRDALRRDSDNPAALLALARQQLAAGQSGEAAASARELLRTSPLQADGFAVLGKAAAQSGDGAQARRLFALALARAPRNHYARAWMIGTLLHDRQYPDALRDIDVLFESTSASQRDLIPTLTRIADHDPAFADALGRHLAQRPRWRPAMLADLLAHASAATVDRVFGVIQVHGRGLTDAEAGQWIARLGKDGRWGAAYSRWISRTGIQAGQGVPLVHDGGFEHATTGNLFDWSMRGEPGVVVERVRGSGGFGEYAARVTFRARRADAIGFQQTLLLAPGRYRLSFRARADDLRSDKGLQWDIRCVTDGAPIASSPRLTGRFDWKTVSTQFAVPADNCPAQRLMLVNPGAGGRGKVVSGQLWVDDFQIAPVAWQAR